MVWGVQCSSNGGARRRLTWVCAGTGGELGPQATRSFSSAFPLLLSFEMASNASLSSTDHSESCNDLCGKLSILEDLTAFKSIVGGF